MAETRHEERYGPYMTANNAPAPFVASASQNAWGAFRAFSESLDDDITFTGLAAGAEQWLQIQLDAPIRIWAFRIACRTTVSAKDAGQVPKNFMVQGSVDGTAFDDVQTYAGADWELFTSWDATNNKYDWADAKQIEIDCPKEYQYYRFLFGECQSVSTQKSGTMTPTASNTVKPTLIDLYRVEGQPDPPSGLDALLNTTEGMEVLVNNTKKDSDTIPIQGVDWFRFNGVATSNLYVSGDHWIGIGANTIQLRVCNRDGAMYYLYRQEGLIYGYYRFLKIRWEGYTRYNYASETYALKFELFLIDTGDMFLNVIQTPTNSSYIGTSSLTCGSKVYTLNIPVDSTPMICFDHQDGTGETWAVRYDKMIIAPPYVRKYLVQDGAGTYYTVQAGALTALETTELTAQIFSDYGLDAAPVYSLIAALDAPAVLCWQDSVGRPIMTADITAVPYNQTVYTDDQDMMHEAIAGIENVVVDADENTLFAISFDGEMTWKAHNGTAWNTLSEEQSGMTKSALEGISVDAWAEVATTGTYQYRFTLPEGGWVKNIKINYLNREENA